MTTTKILASVTMAAALVLATSACSSDGEPKETESAVAEAAANTPTPAAPPKVDEGTDKSLDYTDPSQAEDYCGVFTDLKTFSEEAESQNSEASLGQVEDRMDILARMAGKLADLAESDEEKKQWSAMEDDNRKAVDFLKSSGGNVENDDFIVLLGKAYDSSSKAYEAQAESVEDECGVDLKEFLIDEGEQG